MLIRIALLFVLLINNVSADKIEKCEWNNKDGIPCISIQKTPNSSFYNEQTVSKKIITKKEILESGSLDVNDILKTISGLDIFQSGQKGQQTSLFTRGSESNHTLVLLNGVAINDQSVTDGLHDFGQDFIQTIQQIEIYKGPNGAHFGPSAIAGAINFITDIDYKNSFSVGGFDGENISANTNYTKLTHNGWHLNFKGSTSINKTGSAIAKGTEEDKSKNYQFNLNSKKWINDNTKFQSTFYSRKTKADYDGSATDETGYVSDNKMYAFQSSLESVSKNSENSLVFHYHNYDRNYENSGYLDEYDSESLFVRSESKKKFNKKFSFGLGSEYKYDWGKFENRGSYSASTKGHMKNFGFYGNAGYKFNNNQILSLYGRTDEHNTTSRNETYKLNFTQIFDKLELGLTHSTGLRNPTLYELYGTDNYGITGNIGLNPEKSKTNEISTKYNFTENIFMNITGYKTKIFDQIESNSAYTKHVNEQIDIYQNGIESELTLLNGFQNITIFSNFSKSRKANGQAQSRRPDLSYGANLNKKYYLDYFGNFNLNLNYKHTGKYIDWDGDKNSRQKSTDILDLSFNKKIYDNIYSLNITNLLNERYEKPATYNQDGRKIKINFRRTF